MAKTHTIDITAIAFPADTLVAKGDTVVWTNRMNMPHTVTADNGEFDSGPFGKDKSFSQVFDSVGAIGYHCEIHSMSGTVTVKEEQMAKTHNIDIKKAGDDMVFDPNSQSAAAGDTVVWTNRMSNVAHTVTADDGTFDSGQITPNKTFSHTFPTAGTFAYHCEIHPFMTGTITVGEQQVAQTHNIDIKRVEGQMKFDPDSKSVAKGDTVVWTNRTNVGHTVTADDGAFDSGQLQPNKTFSHAFDSVGTFGYHCDIHPFMTGTITVGE